MNTKRFPSMQVAIFKDKYSSVIGTSGIGEAMVDFIEWFHSSDFGKRSVQFLIVIPHVHCWYFTKNEWITGKCSITIALCVSRADRPVLWPCLMDVKQLRISYYILKMAITIGIIPFQMSSQGYAA